MTRQIVKIPGVCGGRATFAGTRVPAWIIVALLRDEAPETEILEAYPTLSTEDLRAAEAYVKLSHHAAEIDDDILDNTSGPRAEPRITKFDSSVLAMARFAQVYVHAYRNAGARARKICEATEGFAELSTEGKIEAITAEVDRIRYELVCGVSEDLPIDMGLMRAEEVYDSALAALEALGLEARPHKQPPQRG